MVKSWQLRSCIKRKRYERLEEGRKEGTNERKTERIKMSSETCSEAYVTLATNDTYVLGALVWSHSLRGVGTTRKLVVMVTSGVTEPFREQLRKTFDLVTEVDVLNSNDTANLALLARPDLGVTFTKLHCWRLTQFSKCVFMDADTLVLQCIDDLFDRDEFSAAADIGWPDCFNSGVFVYRPSDETYAALLQFAMTHGSFDGGDQGLLNQFFKDWPTKDISRHLPFLYNVVSHAFYSYQPAFKQFGKNAKVVHFIGSDKPWNMRYNRTTGQVDLSSGSIHSAEFLRMWWRIFVERVHPHIDPNVVLLSDQMDRLSVFTKQDLDDQERQYEWERGQIQYLGIDSFSNIQKQLELKLQQQPSQPPAHHHPPQPQAPHPPSPAHPHQPRPEAAKVDHPPPSSPAGKTTVPQTKK